MQDKIDQDIKVALKAGDKQRLNTLKMVKSALQNAAIANMGELSDDDAIKVLKKEAKKRNEAAEMYDGASESERAEAEKAEAAIIDEYLPEQMSEAEIEAIVDKIIADGADNMGQIMGMVMKQTAGQADGGTVSKIVKEKLA